VIDPAVHILLFVVISAAIVLMSAFFSESEDVRALKGMPRRLAVFVVGCAVLTALMLVCEHTFASV
jgi:hypothetical protein